jgi:hypothetical protein
MENRIYENGRGQTVGVQTITLCSLIMPDPSAAIVEMKVAGISQDSLAGGATRSAMVKRVLGAYTNLGDFLATNLKGDAGLVGVVVNVVVLNGALALQVTGIAGKTIDWTGTLQGILHITGQ